MRPHSVLARLQISLYHMDPGHLPDPKVPAALEDLELLGELRGSLNHPHWPTKHHWKASPVGATEQTLLKI